MADYRDLFFLPDDYHYLNCAFMSPLSRRVNRASQDALEVRKLPSNYGVSDFFEPASQARDLFSKILGCGEPSRIALIPATSYGLAIVAKNTKASPSNSVVMVDEQFPSSVNTWSRFSLSTGCKLKLVPRPVRDSNTDQNDFASRWNMSIIDAIDETTVIVCVPHVHWTDGTVFDLAEIAIKSRRVGAKLVVDGTQSIGALDFPFDKIRPDAVVCAGYKWLTGNMGLGAAYFGPAFDEASPLEENWISRANSSDFSNLTAYTNEYVPDASRFDVGQRGIGFTLPIFVEALAQVQEWGTDLIQRHCNKITENALRSLEDSGFQGPIAGAPRHLFGIRLPDDIDSSAFFRLLKARNISVSLRGNYVRVAPHLYNNEDDLAALVDAFGSLT